MPILELQRRLRELGRIRLGEQVAAGKGTRPKALGTFRITSKNSDLIDAVAEYYGGTARPWESPRGTEHEVVIESPFLDVIVPPGEDVAANQWRELWKGGGCARRCDGVTEILSGQPCLCPADPKARQAAAADGNACKDTTRVNVVLPAIPDLGVWRLETHSYYAAVELAGATDTLRAATEQGVYVRARLRIDRRQVKRPNEPRKDFVVPVIEIPDMVLNQLLPAGPVTSGPQRLGSGASVGQRALPPGPALPASAELRPPAPAAVSAAVRSQEAEEAAFRPIDGFEDAPPPAERLSLEGDEFRAYLLAQGVTDGSFVTRVKEALYGDRTSLTAEERGTLALEVVRRAKETTP